MLYDREGEFSVLRQSVIAHLKESLPTSPTANDVHKYVSDISSDEVWVGEDIIATAAEWLIICSVTFTSTCQLAQHRHSSTLHKLQIQCYPRFA